ncbi:MAG: alpha/beta hydrolase [Acidobacteria bacterium]|nr:alpha/beta hydrolase [Acidobacteriota bacterium]
MSKISTEKGRFLKVEGLRTFYRQAGEGHPVLLIHGGAPGACSLVSWKRNIDSLAESGFAVYAVDQPGFGYTDVPTDHSIDFRITHARSFADELGLDRFHLIGSSVGAYIAARIALKDPRVRRLVFVSSSTLAPKGSGEATERAKRHSEKLRQFTPDLEKVRSMTLKTLFKRELVTEELVRERYQMSSGSRFKAILGRREAPSPKPIVEEIPKLTMRTLILWGNNDRGAAVERAFLLFQLLPNAELHVFNQCAHWVQWDQAERFNRLVADFLSGSP